MNLVGIRTWTAGAGNGACGSRLARRDIFLWVAVILFANQIAGVVKGMTSASIITFIFDLCAVGAFQYMAWYVVFYLLRLSDPVPLARWQDFMTAVIMCLVTLLPTTRIIWPAATGIAAYLWFFNRGDLRLRSAGIVLAALSVQEFWGRIFFNLVAIHLMRAETAVVGTMLEATGAGTVWDGNVITERNGHGILVEPGCSSFHNVSLALLCWATVVCMRHQDWCRRDFAFGVVVGAAMILLNAARLYLMALDFDSYQYWHDGAGADIFAVGTSSTILLLSLYGSRPVGQHP